MSVIRDRIIRMFSQAIAPMLESASPEAAAKFSIELDIPKIADHGDYATNAAMSLTRLLKQNPRRIAEQIISNLRDDEKTLAKVEIAGPGFINLFVRPEAWLDVLSELYRDPVVYGHRNVGEGRRIQVEFVSANPTGPLHIGHGRGAATGDVVARILEACGYDVQREYYINDAGNQMDTLGRSLWYRYREVRGETIEFPENHYQGEYMRELALEFAGEFGDVYLSSPLDEVLPVFTRYAGESILAGIRDDLEVFGVSFDHWFSERTLHGEDAVRKTLESLRTAGFVYDSEGAVWFRSTAFGDEKDRVVVRANGISTYFAADLAYHHNKFGRGFEKIVDIWGADHHGYVDRMAAGIQAMGKDRSALKVILVQLVNLLRAGKPVAMSTRSGEFVTLREVVDEVGKDAARYIFLTRRSDSPLDFDLDVAKAKSNDNPVYYVQYAHARLCSIFEVARERGVPCDFIGRSDVELPAPLDAPMEISLMKMIGEYPAVLTGCAENMEPHLITYYLHDLVSLFHSYYNANRIIGDDAALTQARLYLATAVREVIRNALGILGVSAPEKM